MTSQDRRIVEEIGRILDRADLLEKAEKADPKPKISYGDFIRRRHSGTDCTCVYCTTED